MITQHCVAPQFVPYPKHSVDQRVILSEMLLRCRLGLSPYPHQTANRAQLRRGDQIRPIIHEWRPVPDWLGRAERGHKRRCGKNVIAARMSALESVRNTKS